MDGGIHVLLRAKSRALWWFSKCLALTVWNLLYFAVGFCSVCVFCFFTNGLSCFTILPYDVLPCDALTCLLPFGFALAISLLAFCLCIFCSFVWGQVFAISCLVAVSFTEFPSPFSLLCHADFAVEPCLPLDSTKGQACFSTLYLPESYASSVCSCFYNLTCFPDFKGGRNES